MTVLEMPTVRVQRQATTVSMRILLFMARSAEAQLPGSSVRLIEPSVGDLAMRPAPLVLHLNEATQQELLEASDLLDLSGVSITKVKSGVAGTAGSLGFT